MATVSIEAQVQEQVREIVALLMKRPITEEIAMRVGSIDGFKHLEIRNGQWVGFEQDEYMTGEEHGWIETLIIHAITTWVLANDAGRVYPGDMDFVLSGKKEDLRHTHKPDVAYVSKKRVQKTKGYYYGAPDLAVEIVSPNDKEPEIRQKINEYIHHSTKQVWQVYPKTKQIVVHLPDGTAKTYGVDDLLPGGDLLPGFMLDVAMVFET
jgi:Uma2 family endonuclease